MGARRLAIAVVAGLTAVGHGEQMMGAIRESRQLKNKGAAFIEEECNVSMSDFVNQAEYLFEAAELENPLEEIGVEQQTFKLTSGDKRKLKKGFKAVGKLWMQGEIFNTTTCQEVLSMGCTMYTNPEKFTSNTFCPCMGESFFDENEDVCFPGIAGVLEPTSVLSSDVTFPVWIEKFQTDFNETGLEWNDKLTDRVADAFNEVAHGEGLDSNGAKLFDACVQVKGEYFTDEYCACIRKFFYYLTPPEDECVPGETGDSY